MAVKFKSFVLHKDQVHKIDIEVEILNGMPDFNILGLSDRSIRESKERIRAAIKNMNYKFPVTRKLVNLTPASLPKKGNHFDLPILLGLLIRSGQIKIDYSNKLFLGSIGLAGELKKIDDIIPVLESAKLEGFDQIFIPEENFEEADQVEGVNLIPIKNVKQIIEDNLDIPMKSRTIIFEFEYPTFDDIINQQIAKRILLISIAGTHNALFIGSPGFGKSMLAQSSKNLLKNISKFHTANSHLSKSEAEKILKQLNEGILVINELPEINKQTLEALKDPLETKQINKIPCVTSVIATMNPCKCGYANNPHKVCYCTPYNRKLFDQKISASLLERFDLALELISDPVSDKPSKKSNSFEETKKAHEQVQKVKQIQLKRETPNSLLPLKEIIPQLEYKAKTIAQIAEKKFSTSTRRYLKILQIARTIADLENSESIKETHIAESITHQKYLLTHSKK